MRRSIALFCLLMSCLLAHGQQACVTDGIVHPSGVVGNIDLPLSDHMKNAAGSDGSGLCVFTSIQHAARWHYINEFMRDFQRWMMTQPGGGHPSKVDAKILEYCKVKGIQKPPDYLQNTAGNIDLLAFAVQKGYMPGVTYCISPTGRYGGKVIAHMVNCVAARCGPNRDMWAILDNNYPGTIEWMTEAQFIRSFKGNSGGWFFIWLAPPPPPIPKNR